jgi:hypothetical protein
LTLVALPGINNTEIDTNRYSPLPPKSGTAPGQTFFIAKERAMPLKKIVGASFLAPLLFVTAAFADDVAPLASGTVAGVEGAQETNSNIPLYVGLGVLAAAAIFAATSGGGNGATIGTATGTTSTGTNP